MGGCCWQGSVVARLPAEMSAGELLETPPRSLFQGLASVQQEASTSESTPFRARRSRTGWGFSFGEVQAMSATLGNSGQVVQLLGFGVFVFRPFQHARGKLPVLDEVLSRQIDESLETLRGLVRSNCCDHPIDLGGQADV